MTIKCTMCDKKEFSAIIESHRDLKDQPALICYEYFCDYCALCEDVYDDDAEPVLFRYVNERAKLLWNRCK